MLNLCLLVGDWNSYENNTNVKQLKRINLQLWSTNLCRLLDLPVPLRECTLQPSTNGNNNYYFLRRLILHYGNESAIGFPGNKWALDFVEILMSFYNHYRNIRQRSIPPYQIMKTNYDKSGKRKMFALVLKISTLAYKFSLAAALENETENSNDDLAVWSFQIR
jgi:hypothetical protein